MKIAILDDYQNVVKDLDCFNLLSEHEVVILNKTIMNEEELSSKIKEVEALVLIRERTFISEKLLKNLPKLKIISQTGKISSHISKELCDKYGIKIVEGLGSAIAPSELCWALIMNATRHINDYINNFKNNLWQDSGYKGLGKSLYGQTIGIWGYGKIGQKIASYAKVFGMNVVIWGSIESRKKAFDDGFKTLESKEEFFRTCDIVTLHLRLSETSKYCVTRNDLELMKSGSLFVNISRDQLVEKDALYKVLCSRKDLYAAIDVYEYEPILPKNNSLLTLPNLLATPHLGYVEKNSYELYFKVAFENILNEIKNC